MYHMYVQETSGLSLLSNVDILWSYSGEFIISFYLVYHM